MSKARKVTLIYDCESTIIDSCADVGAIIVDRKGNILHELAVLVEGHYGTHELFHDKKASAEIWSLRGLEKRKLWYKEALQQGTRSLASVAAVNRWLERARGMYPDIELTAYNLSYDMRISRNTGIDLDQFDKRYCLWHAATATICQSKEYKNYCLQNKHLTAKLNVITNAEVVAAFVRGFYEDEPHCAREDLAFEKDVMMAVYKNRNWRKKLSEQGGYSWQAWQAKDIFTAK